MRILRYVLVGLLGLGLVIGLVFGGHAALAAIARSGYEAELEARGHTPRAEVLPRGRLLVRNPVMETGQDPWIAHVPSDTDAPFHYVYTEEVGLLHLKRATDLFGYDTIAPYYSWDPDDDPATAGLQMLWAPELHEVAGHWVVYFAANSTNSFLTGTHRMHVLTARDDADLTRGFRYAGELELPGDRWAIDGTVFRHGGKLYHVWSGWPEGETLNQRLYICEMADAYTAAPGAERVEISRPTHDWELRGRRLGLWPSINEGPVELRSPDGERSFLVYSASGSWSDHYCLGLLELTGDDPLDPAAWRKHPEPLLVGDGDVIAPGHNGFVRRGGELLLLHHAAKYSRAAWDREVWVGKVGFDGEGAPVLEALAGEVEVPAL